MNKPSSILCLLACASLLAFESIAATFIVTTTNDSGGGSLREAITQANATAGADTIAFSLTGATRTINVSNALPDLTESLTIDGSTQPGFAGTPIIEINGVSAGAGGVDGFRVLAANCTIRAVVINRFTGDGIEIATNGNNLVEGCYLGLNAAGTVDLGNTVNGIFITNSANNVIGGVFATQRNVISGNNGAGILIGGLAATNNQILGNIIGLNVTNNPVANSAGGIRLNASLNLIGNSANGARNFISGNAGNGIELLGATNTGNRVSGNSIGADLTGLLDRGNGADGILINNSGGHVIGGSNPGEGNLVSGNSSNGIEINGLGATNNIVVGNLIGTTTDGVAGMANSGSGVFITFNSRSNVVGGISVGAANVIAFNSQDGIAVAAANGNTNNVFRGNSLHSNGDLGIDLGTSGVTANDNGDADAGANQLQNFPVLSAVTNTPTEVIIVGSLNSRPATTYTLDFYSNVAFDSTGNGEGQTWLGATNLTTAANSNVNFTVSFPIANLPGRYVTATATDPFGNTSEFATNSAAVSTVPGLVFTVVNTNDSGPGSLRQAILNANAAVTTGDTIEFAITNLSTTINLVSPLPPIVDAVTINGYTQPGSALNSSPTAFNGTVLVRLAGNSAGAGADGLSLLFGDCIVRGLMITGFAGDGIELSAGGNHVIEGNLIGLDAAGTDQGNTGNGILINNSSNNRIGGASPGARNVISGNNSDGIEIGGAAGVGNRVLGNLIGTDPTGLLDVGNTANGVLAGAGATIIGGANPGEGNLISGNNGSGVELNGTPATNNVVLGNRLGTDASGTLALGNSTGVNITSNSRSNVVGGVSTGQANLIAFNAQDGIAVAAANANTNNTFRGNSIHSNGDLGIDLATTGITANDFGDADGGANQLQNFPVLTTVTNTPAGVIIVGSLNSRPSTTYTVDFYSNLVPDNSGNGQGQAWFGSTNLTTGADSNVAFTVSLPVASLQGRYITATATDPFGNTSEFATNVFARSTVAGVIFTVFNTNHSGPGSLRQAMLDANAAVTVLDTIAFAITNLSTTIAPTSALPAIVDAVLIDGYTQPGAQANSLADGNNAVLKVQLSGANAPNNVDGLRLESEGSIIRGLSIVGFKGASGDGIEIVSANNTIEGNFIGLLPDGTNTLGNAGNGILINSSGNIVGGSTPAARNVICGNSGDGIELAVVGAANNVVAGNFIGTDAGGMLDRGNGGDGILINGAPGNLIGGATSASRNVISGNQSEGVTIQGTTATNNQVLNNYIGTDPMGTLLLGNGSHGVFLASGAPSGNVIGSPNPGGNLIAFNGGDGVSVSTGTNNAIRANSIFSNGGATVANLGIDLGANGILPNDFPDVATGANLQQNFPELSSATANPTDTQIQGTLRSRPNTVYQLDFFSDLSPDPSRTGEGQKWLGSTSLTTDANGSNVFNVTVPGVVLGRHITATATDPFGNTSEFGTNILAGSTIPPATFFVRNTNDSGPESLRQAILDNNNTVSGTNNLVRFEIPGAGPHVISLLTALPVPTERVTIDGYTQLGAQENTLTNGNNAVLKIQLDGLNTGFGADGIRLTGIGGNIVRGLSILHFSDGIELGNNGNNRVEGNFIGLDLDGVTQGFNASYGIHANNSPGNVIGGTTPASRNVISGNNISGILITGAGAQLNRVQGNYLGTDKSGTLDRGNGSNGVQIDDASTNTVGGTEVLARNLISGNNFHGISIGGSSQGNLILGNYIGSDVTGGAALANANDGVYLGLFGGQGGNAIGGTNVGAGNLIAFNTRNGVTVANGTNNPIRANAIFANISLDIDLDANLGVAANDPGDPDTGANQLQNYPGLAAGSTITPTNTTIQGSLNSRPNTTYELDFFANVFPDPVYPNGEGQQILGSTTVTTGPDSNANFNVTLPVVAMGRHLTATATDPFGNTSEFSRTFAAVSTFPPVTFVVTNTLDSGPGSLRQAILNNNATPTSTNNVISFNIPGAGPHVIAPSNVLLTITEPVTIDGFSQPGATTNTLVNGNNANLKIVLVGTNAAFGVPGLSFSSSGNLVRGLNLIGFRDSGIMLNTQSNVVEGCVIGLRLDSSIQGNSANGVSIGGAGNRIGGTSPGARNVISGNSGHGISINGAGATNNLVQGNFLGTDIAGTLDRGNGFAGVNSSASGTIIGGSVAGAGNVIAGNNGSGVNVSLPANDTTIKGNRIGLAVTDAFLSVGNSTAGVTLGSGVSVVGGASALERNFISGNFGPGIQINTFGTNSLILGNYIGTDGSGTLDRANFGGGIAIASSGTRVGGVAAGEGNVIAFNSFAGISINSGTNNSLRANRIFNNLNLGIDLGFSGVTSNDLGVADADVGPNGLQNFPELTNAVANVGNTLVQGRLDSRPNTVFQLDFYASQSPDPSAHGEGQFWLGSTNVTTDGAGLGRFSAVASPLVAGARLLTATATDPDGNTSEFSMGVSPATTIPPEAFTVVNTNDSGPGSLRQALLDVDLLPSAGNDTIRFAIPGSGVRTIAPLSALPTPQDSVTIDGFTQSGSRSNSLPQGNNAVWLIRLDGTNLPASAAHGLSFTNHHNLIRGLEIIGATYYGINLNSGSSNVVAGNLIWSNLSIGVFASGGSGNVIGGQTADARNVISANGGYGVELEINTNSAIQGNFLGTDPTGTTALGGGGGVLLEGGLNNLIGGTNPLRNVISGSDGVGIQVTSFFNPQANIPLGHRILGNLIGTDVTGTLAVSNQFGGIILGGAVGTTIGGTNANEPNLIAFNVNGGIQISASPANATNNFILANSIYDNTGLGIDIGVSGVTANDPGDADSGANQFQNFPILTNAAITTSNLIAQGTLSSRPATTYRLDFYANPACDPSGNGEGKHWLGSATVATGADSNAAFNVNLPLPPEGLLLTATATDPSGNTSEFSACQQAISLIPSVTFVVTNASDSGPGTLRKAIEDHNATFTSGANRIEFNIAGSGVKTISPLTPLPVITRSVTIDGFTQPGAQADTPNDVTNTVIWLIRLDGSSASPAPVDGLHLTSSSNLIRGLVIVNFTGDGIELESGNRSLISECLLGIDVDNTGFPPPSPAAAADISQPVGGFGGGDEVKAAGGSSGGNGTDINMNGSSGNIVDLKTCSGNSTDDSIRIAPNSRDNCHEGAIGLKPSKENSKKRDHRRKAKAGRRAILNEGPGTKVRGDIGPTGAPKIQTQSWSQYTDRIAPATFANDGQLLHQRGEGILPQTQLFSFATLTAALNLPTETTINGFVPGFPGNPTDVIFFTRPPGEDFWTQAGQLVATPDASGNALFNTSLPPVPPGTEIKNLTFNSIGGASQDSSDYTVTSSILQPATDLAISKTASASNVTVNSNFTYTLTVTNLGPNSATNVIVYDTLPSGTYCVGASTTWGKARPNFASVQFDLDTLTNGQVVTMTVEARAFTTGQFTNSASVDTFFANPDLNVSNNSATNIIQAVQPVTIQFNSSPLTVPEGGTAQILGTRSGNTTTAAQFDVVIANGSASNGEDFNAPLVIPVNLSPGQTTFAVNVPTVQDSFPERTEDFVAVLSPPPSDDPVLGSLNSTRVFIVNDDGPPVNDLIFMDPFRTPDGFPVFDWTGLPGQAYLQCAPALGQSFMTMPGAAPPFTFGPSGAGVPDLFGTGDLLFQNFGSQEFFRLTDTTPAGTVSGTVHNPDGSSAGSKIIRIGDSHQVTATDLNGNFTLPNVPAGDVPISFEQVVTVSNIVSGQIEFIWIRIVAFVTLTPGSQLTINVEVELPKEIPKPPCNCIPWCGIVGGTFNGVQKVVAGGGKRGNCTDAPVVVVTGPGGINEGLLAKRKTYSPAASGTWKVTSTICGQTKTCEITLP